MNQSNLNRARNDKFLLVLDLPKILKPENDPVLKEHYDMDSLQFTCYGSPVPAISIPSIDLPFGGQTFKTSSNSRPSFPSLDITFLVDNGYKNYWLLATWLNLFNDSQTSIPAYNAKNLNNIGNTNKIPFKDLVSTFSTYALDEYNKKIMKFHFNTVFPTNLGEISYSHQDPSEINCKISFSFFQFTPMLIKNIDEANC